MVGYFAIGVPRIGIFDGYLTKEVNLARNVPSFYLRILPPVVGLTYLCNLDILLSFWAFRLLAVLKEGLMARVGFAVGYAGQQAEAGEILSLESHGALVFLALWSVWIAWRHLLRVLRVAWEGRPCSGDDGLIPYRFALLGLGISTIYVAGWFMGMGLSLPLALLHIALTMWLISRSPNSPRPADFPTSFPLALKGDRFFRAWSAPPN